jgi:hypothetical protein
MGEKSTMYKLLAGKPEGMKPLGRLSCSLVNNIKMDLVETGWGGVDWTGQAQHRDEWKALMYAVMNLQVL